MEKDLGVLVAENFNMSRAVSKEVWPVGQGRWCSALLYSHEISPVYLYTAQLFVRQHVDLSEWVQKMATNIIRELQHFSNKKRLRI